MMSCLKVYQGQRDPREIQLLKDILIDRERRLKRNLNMPKQLFWLASKPGIVGYPCPILIEN